MDDDESTPSSAFVSANPSPCATPRAPQIPPPPPPSSPFSSQSEETRNADRSDFSDDPADHPRPSFSFQVPRISFASSAPPPSKLRSCDVYIGFHDRSSPPSLLRFCNWLRSELELQGIACFVADREKYSDTQSHETADRVICSVALGIVVINGSTFANHLTLEEIRFFSRKNNLIPIFFEKEKALANEEYAQVIKNHDEFNLKTDEDNWRSCIWRTTDIVAAKLGRKKLGVQRLMDEIPFQRNNFFVGREEIITEIETSFFRGNHNGGNVVCISGDPGDGKTEVALEFAYRFQQRYKMVLWVGGEALFFRHNILNLSTNLGIDIGADPEKQRGRLRNFGEQEFEAFKRIKQELFRDLPYLIIIDDLEPEKELQELIPRNSNGSHVIITTRLLAVLNFYTIHLPRLDAITKQRRWKKHWCPNPDDFFIKFGVELKGSTFGLCLIRSMISEFTISATDLFQILTQKSHECDSLNPYLSNWEERYCKGNPFIMKIMAFCCEFLEQKNLLALQMLFVGSWFAQAPISVNLLAAAAKIMNKNGSKKWVKCLSCLSLGDEVEESGMALVRLGLARSTNVAKNKESGVFMIQFHPIAQIFGKMRHGRGAGAAMVEALTKMENPGDVHLWASSFLLFGSNSWPRRLQLKTSTDNTNTNTNTILFVKNAALPLAIRAFNKFSMCNSALELLEACTDALEEAEKTFHDFDLCNGLSSSLSSSSSSSFLRGRKRSKMGVEEVKLLKAKVLETGATLLLRGGDLDNGEQMCRSCVSIRTSVLGRTHAHTLVAQETLAKIVRLRTNI